MPSPRRFLDLLETEITAAERAARTHERHGDVHMADWWRQRGADLRHYLDGRLTQREPSPGVVPLTPRPAPLPAAQGIG